MPTRVGRRDVLTATFPDFEADFVSLVELGDKLDALCVFLFLFPFPFPFRVCTARSLKRGDMLWCSNCVPMMLRLDHYITVTAIECDYLRDSLGKAFAIAKKQFDAFKVSGL